MSQAHHFAVEKLGVDELQEDAGRLMEVLEAGVQAGLASGEWMVFVGPEGGYQMISGYGGSLESLEWDRGASRAWRVGRQRGHLVVEGRGAAGRCVIERAAPDQQARRILSQAALYRV